MTRDDIIRLGRESQRECFSDGGHWFSMEVRDLERFAALVAVEEHKALKHERRRDMAEICSLRESEETLREEVERLREALTVAAKAELYDPATGIIDADVLAIVQDTARAALRQEEP